MGAVALGALVLIFVADMAPAQEWFGETTLRGTVTDTEGQPIAGARVELRWAADNSQGPPSTATNQNGAWRILRLAPGRYELHIRATGFINVNGWATVSAAKPANRIEAQMLPLSWEPPAFSTGNPLTMRQWIEKGNSLLEQGHSTEARKEFQRALAQLSRARQPEVLRGIARTHYLEGRIDLAADSLRQAVEIAPSNPENRQLFLSVMEHEGRKAEAEEMLSELDSRPPAASEEPEMPILPPPVEIPAEIEALLAAPAEPPQPHRIGRYKTSFLDSSPWSRPDDYAGRIGASAAEFLAAAPAAVNYLLAEESFQVLVPDSYEPAADWGLLVWISPTPFGGSRSPEMAEALARHRLIWIGANNSGNSRAVWERIWLALDAATNMQGLYDLDPDRIYIGGYSGGGRTASRMGVLFPELVRGVWAQYGCDYFRPIPVVERPGTSYPAKYARPSKDVLKVVQRRNRFVLVTGTRDFNFTQTRLTARAMEKDGFERVTYLEIPDANHYTFPDAEWLGRIFAALDED